MSLTRKQRRIRQYLFRALVARHDAERKGVMVLTWREARNMWRGATIAAELTK